jgi:hypothetical protein
MNFCGHNALRFAAIRFTFVVERGNGVEGSGWIRGFKYNLFAPAAIHKERAASVRSGRPGRWRGFPR